MDNTSSAFQSDGGKVPDVEALRSIVEAHRPDLNVYAELYRNTHQGPGISGSGQHIVPSIAGTVSIRSKPVLVAADSVRVRVIAGPCKDSINPQLCVDLIPLSMRIIQDPQDKIKKEFGKHKDVTVACWGFHAVMNAIPKACLQDPVFNYTVRAPLTSNDEAMVSPISKVFETCFGPNAG
ncbi:hypothetical protein HG530_010648 [Fusarium avenaceum]|nr:hypothetical protein HG530_010648 [Fusarium avenaceum]